MRVFLTAPDELDRLWQPYGDAMQRDLATIFDNIPATDVSIQWDVCVEMLAYDPLTDGISLGSQTAVPKSGTSKRWLTCLRTCRRKPCLAFIFVTVTWDINTWSSRKIWRFAWIWLTPA